jgi:drug/metabolite transporter (DMT)-like permease
MRAIHVAGLLTLSLLWGCAYLFMRSAVPQFGPVPLVALRMGIAAIALAPLMMRGNRLQTVRHHLGQLAIMGLPFTALPFVMLAFASMVLVAAKVAILQATAPLFAALIGHFWLGERIGALRALGLVIGFCGVGLLVWGKFDLSWSGAAAATGAALAASAIWGLSGNYAKRRMAGIDPMAMTFGNLGLAALALAPLAAAYWPDRPPSMRAWLEVLFLGAASSGLGFVLYFSLLRRIGAVRAISVTFLNPPVAMLTASLYLGETVTMQMVLGCAVILAGTALSLGLVGRRVIAGDATRAARSGKHPADTIG